MKLQRLVLSSTLVLGAMGLVGCSSWSRNTPKLNPHPKYYLTLKGHIDKRLRDKVALRFMPAYVGYNPKCATETDVISGIMENPARTFTHLVKPDSKGNYELKIPIDKYLPGYCQWDAYAVGITLTNEEYYYNSEGLDFVHFSNTESTAKSSRLYNYLCPEQVNNPDTGDNCYAPTLPGQEDPNYVRTNRSTSIIVNIHYKEK